MKKNLTQFSLPAGLLIWVVYKIVDRWIGIKDAIGIPMLIVSVILMMIGIAYHGWCFGRGKSPCNFKGKRKD